MIDKINVNGTLHDIHDSRVNATDIANMLDNANYVPSGISDTNTTYLLTVNGTTAGDSTNGTNLGSIYAPTTAGTSGQYLVSSGSGAPAWGSAPTPSYLNINYSINTQTGKSGAITIDPTIPIHHITLSGNVSSVTFTSGKVPEDGHSTHVFFYSTSARTIAINSNATMATVSGTTYTSLTPDNKAYSISLSVNSSKGYVEVDFLRVGTNILVRGV